MNEDYKPLSHNPLKIFISSSWQGELNTFNELAAKIIDSKGFIPITGDGGSSVPPQIHCDRKVKEADIVIVLLKNELRDAVKREVYTALDERKTVLAVIIDAEREQDAEDFIEKLKKNVTYITVHSESEFEKGLEYLLIDEISWVFKNYNEIYRNLYKMLMGGPLILRTLDIEGIVEHYVEDIEKFLQRLIDKHSKL